MISLFKVFMSDDNSKNLEPILKSGYIAQGPQVELFETKLKEYFNYPYILSLNSATSGLTLAVKLLNLCPDDEVISTPLTCTATNWPILANGVKIKWADVDPETCNISMDSIREKITEKTKAIMVVHWGGYPVDLDELKLIQDETEIKYGFRPMVIEDCAHAFGAKYNDKYIGTTHGNICVFSLQAIKHLTTGDGGLIFLPKELYDRAKLLRWFGIDRNKRSGGGDLRLESDISEWGYKYHMNDINATIGLSNLPHINTNLNKLRENANMYRERLSKLAPYVVLLKEDDKCISARWIFTIKIYNKTGFIDFMTKRNIMVSQVHNRNDHHSCISNSRVSLPNLDILEKDIICVPAGWWLSDQEKDHVLSSIEEWCDMNTIVFRKIFKDDYYMGFLELLSQLNGYDYSMTYDEFTSKLEQINDGDVYVGILNGMLVCTGKIQLEHKFGKSVIHIEDIVVDSKFRRQQIGQRLIKFLIDTSSSLDPYKLVLSCKDELVPFYEGCGFTKFGASCSVRYS